MTVPFRIWRQRASCERRFDQVKWIYCQEPNPAILRSVVAVLCLALGLLPKVSHAKIKKEMDEDELH